VYKIGLSYSLDADGAAPLIRNSRLDLLQAVLPPGRAEARNLAALLVERDRVADLPAILELYRESRRDLRGVVVADGGDFVATASYVLRPRGPLSWLDPGVFGTLGVGAGFALGAATARPAAETWIVFGDGACGYGLAEFDSFVRQGIPVIAVVGNDAGWTQIAREQVKMLGDDVATVLARTAYHEVAAGFGAAGLLVQRAEEVRPALAEARRLAKAGYVAVAPDLASRAGGTAKLGGQIQGFFANAKPDELVSDLNAAIAFLGQQNGVVSDKYGVVGFCFGGAYTLRLAAANPKIAAAVSYYGPVPDPATQIATTNAAILGQYGANDARVNGTIPALEQAMAAAGKTFEKRVYDGAGHAFNNDTGANYNQEAAVAAWSETLGWFQKYLKG